MGFLATENMKTRAGFVSNSSSASFIVRWREREGYKSENLDEAVARLFELRWYDAENDTWCSGVAKREKEEWDLMEKAQEVGEWVLKNTKEEDGYYETDGFTRMMNSYADFPWQMMYFVFAVDQSRGIEVISKVLDDS